MFIGGVLLFQVKQILNMCFFPIEPLIEGQRYHIEWTKQLPISTCKILNVICFLFTTEEK